MDFYLHPLVKTLKWYPKSTIKPPREKNRYTSYNFQIQTKLE